MRKKFDYAFRALWSLFVISVFRHDDSGLDSFIGEIRKDISDFEAEFSRFVPDSALSILNRTKAFEVSDRFRTLLSLCFRAYRESEGYFNPLLDVSRFGYVHDFERGKFEHRRSGEPLRTDFERVEIQKNLVLLQEGMHLDFWAVGKGFLADSCAKKFREAGFSDAILNFWGDIAVLWGGADGPFHRIGLMSPFDEGGVFATLDVSGVSVSTSGNYLRKWKTPEGEFRHIVFPSAVPAGESCASVTVVHPEGAVSDAFATALFAAGIQKWIRIAESASVDALFVSEGRKILSTPGFAQKWRLRSG